MFALILWTMFVILHYGESMEELAYYYLIVNLAVSFIVGMWVSEEVKLADGIAIKEVYGYLCYF